MDPYIAKLIGRSPTQKTNIVPFDGTRRRRESHLPAREFGRYLQKQIGLAPGTVKYRGNGRTFLLIRQPLSDKQRELLTVENMLVQRRAAQRSRMQYATQGDVR